jgi:multidrug resistance efflux pump
MPFLDTESKVIVVNIAQNGYRNVKVGNRAELVFELYPGQVFKGKVRYIVPANSAGEITPSGLVATIKSASEPFLIELELDEPIDTLPAGAVGTAAIYTDSLKITHPVRAVMLRGRTWLNYL